jgi:hypothetical protein
MLFEMDSNASAEAPPPQTSCGGGAHTGGAHCGGGGGAQGAGAPLEAELALDEAPDGALSHSGQ